MNILSQRWFPIGDIDVGVLLSSHIGLIGSILGFQLAILALAISCGEISGQYLLAIGACDMASYRHPIMVYNTGVAYWQSTSDQYRANYWDYIGPLLT